MGGVDPARFNRKVWPPTLTFERGESIARWYSRNFMLGANKGGGFLNGTDSEKRLEFRYDPSRVPPGPKPDYILGILKEQPIDSRLYGATAQFLAAGSYGLLHATVYLWDDAPRATLMNTVHDLGPTTTNCLTDLVMTPPTRTDTPHNARAASLAVRLAAASHAYYRTVHPTLSSRIQPRRCGPGDPSGVTCSQEEWMSYWSIIVGGYNWGGSGYAVSGGLTMIGRAAIRNYDAK